VLDTLRLSRVGFCRPIGRCRHHPASPLPVGRIVLFAHFSPGALAGVKVVILNDLPTPEQFGLTEAAVKWATAPVPDHKDQHVWLLLPLSVLGALFTYSFVGVSWKSWFILAWMWVMWIGALSLLADWLNRAQRAKAEKEKRAHPTYLKYVAYQFAMAKYQSALEITQQTQARAKEEALRVERQRLREQEAWWKQLDGRAFEVELATLFRQRGYEVRKIGGSGDGGVDLILRLQGKKILVQCKAHKNPIGPGTIRELYGTLIHNRADEAWLVTTSGFHRGAKDFAQGKKIRLLTMHQILRGWAATGSVPPRN